MPQATVKATAKRFELKSAPPDGFVKLKRLSFGQKLERMEMATKQVIHNDDQKGNRAQRRSGNNQENMSVDIRMMQRIVTEYEFKHCVVEHNLTHENGQALNFKDSATVDLLDPKIGEEISEYIAELNNFEGEEEDNEDGNTNLPSQTESENS